MKNRLEELREARGMSQEELAQALCISQQTVASMEAGRYDPSVLLAHIVARQFELPIEEVFLCERKALPEDYWRKKKRNYIVQAIIGFGLIVLSAFLLSNTAPKIAGPLVSAGTTVCLSGFLWLAKMGSAKQIETELVELKDERNQLILGKSIFAAYLTMFLVLAAALILIAQLMPDYTPAILHMSGVVLLSALLPAPFSYYYAKRY